MATEKIDVSPHVKRVLEHIKNDEGHLTIDSVIRSRLRVDDWNFYTPTESFHTEGQ